MKTCFFTLLILLPAILSSFAGLDTFSSELRKLQKLEQLALSNNNIGKKYVYDLTKKKGCNKTAIKYLGVIKTSKGKQYKVLSSFFVFSASSTCHGTSNIKIYDMRNKYLGKYDVAMPENLPAKITENKLLWMNSKSCNLRNGFSISFKKGLLKKFFIPCSKEGGDLVDFSSE